MVQVQIQAEQGGRGLATQVSDGLAERRELESGPHSPKDGLEVAIYSFFFVIGIILSYECIHSRVGSFTVTESTSSTEVSPARAFRTPSSRIVLIPNSLAIVRICEALPPE